MSSKSPQTEHDKKIVSKWNMTDLTDEQKSVLLAKAMGWWDDLDGKIYDDDFKYVCEATSFRDGYMPNLYDPANMALAWRVLNWAMDKFLEYAQETNEWKYRDTLMGLLLGMPTLYRLPPADAQRLWLDKIFELAVEAGIVEVEESIHG